MRKYETLILLSPDLAVEERRAILDNLTGVIEREQGLLLVLDDWGMRDLAYPVYKIVRGNYVRLEYAAGSTLIAELERIIRITDGIFKFITVKLADKFVPQPQEEAV
ncbi:30S ribosomal protein S6 [Desulfovibrionales bacterium]